MLGADRRDVSGIWIQEGSDASRDKALLKAAAARGITPEYASKHDLNMLTGGGSRPHNGVVADASPLAPTPMDSLPLPDGYTPGVGTPPVWLALDEVVDPQNLGAVLRSAHFLGVSGVVVCAKNSVSVFLCVFVRAISGLTSCFFLLQAPLSPVASKASSGALERMDVRSVGVMPRFLARCVEEGWDVFGTDNSADAEAVTDVKVLKPTVVVVGNGA
jgi:21S rRNA (GM2251-2'-O)-methyltransferase